jgi:hypothetical protein
MIDFDHTLIVAPSHTRQIVQQFAALVDYPILLDVGNHMAHIAGPGIFNATWLYARRKATQL